MSAYAKRMIVLVGALAGAGAAWAAPGSWEGKASAPLLAVPARHVDAEPMVPPALAQGRRLGEVRWSFQAETEAALKAWLCHPERCVELEGSRGYTANLTGLDAGAPLHFRFYLPAGARPAQPKGLEVLVEYR